MNNFCVFFFLLVFVRCTPLHRLSCLLVNLTCLYLPFESRLLWQRVRVLSYCPSAIRSWHTKPTQQTRWIPKFSFRNTKIWTLKSCRSHLAYNSLLPFADSDWATNSECIHCKLNVFIQSLNLFFFLLSSTFILLSSVRFLLCTINMSFSSSLVTNLDELWFNFVKRVLQNRITSSADRANWVEHSRYLINRMRFVTKSLGCWANAAMMMEKKRCSALCLARKY